jgi:pimeloyl-ACP methyl ester carboxylesterase
MPLVVIEAAYPPWKVDAPPGWPVDRVRPARHALPVALANLVSESVHLIADQSGHYVQEDQPDLVVDAIRLVVERVRGVRTSLVGPQ